eukprot:3662036-Ditylum_brightwellii.AAC.2
MSVSQYTTRTEGVTYVDSPNHPGVYDATVANNSGQVMLSCREAEHKQRVDNHMIKKAVKNIIKIMLDEVFPHWLGQIDDNLVDEYTNTYNSTIDMSKGFNTYVERQ